MKNKNCKICGKILPKGCVKTCSKSCSGKLGRDGRPKKHHRMVNGYKEVFKPEFGRKNKYVREHIVVISELLGRNIRYPENVHHIDGDKVNNKPENLYLCKDISEHTKIHHSMELVVLELYRKGLVTFRDGKYEAVAKLYLALNKKDTNDEIIEELEYMHSHANVPKEIMDRVDKDNPLNYYKK